ncbi:MAG: hypothetical protein VB112_02145, partial [Oscillospiraceae bacterium]|nr:hypothetical protein [Oscillospiraceae bacterium]
LCSRGKGNIALRAYSAGQNDDFHQKKPRFFIDLKFLYIFAYLSKNYSTCAAFAQDKRGAAAPLF